MKFSIRDLLLVTVIVALSLGWWANRRQFATQCEESEKQRDHALAEAGDWKFKATSLAETMRREGWKVDLDRDSAISLISPTALPPNASAPAPNPPKP